MSRLLIAGALVVASLICLSVLQSRSDRNGSVSSTVERTPETTRVVWVQQDAANETVQTGARLAQAQAETASGSENSDQAIVLSERDSYDDFASVVQTRDGTVYAAYAAYYNGHDQIRIHRRLPGGNWSTRTNVPLVQGRADIWMPQLAVDAEDRLWVIWCEQTELTKTHSGNWDLYARAIDRNSWGSLQRLTTDPKPDINPHVATDERGNIHVVWQAHPKNYGNIQYCKFDGTNWSRPMAVTSGQTSDWYPSIDIDSNGKAWIAFDSYRNGDYDVFLTSVEDGRAGRLVPIATTNYYEAHASVACTPDGRVWVSWEQGGWNWGKDQGYSLRIQNKNQGSTLGSARSVRVAAYQKEQLFAAPSLDDVLDDSEPKFTAMAGLAAGEDGRLWLRFRQKDRSPALLRANRRRSFWTENVTYLTADGWSKPQKLRPSNGRISVFSRQMVSDEGSLLVALSGDQRGAPNYHQPIHDRALVAEITRPTSEPAVPSLSPYEAPQPPEGASEWDNRKEQRDVAAIREHRVDVDGQSLQIVRGDLHRHTELSWDVGPGNDGSYLDFYRYMIDVAAMDFGGLTDHQGGGHYAYHWWLSEKSSDMFYLEPRFVPLYGYERSATFPNGHRNVFHSYRGVPVFPFQFRPERRGVFPGVAGPNLVDNDTKLLYEYLRRTNGIAISHTSGTTTMGTDWRDNDPEVEPVVEIYQGARNSYEVVGGPRVHDIANLAPARAPGGFQEAGMVWNALEKGYRLGTTSSSDHGSTHISYSLVFTPANDRESILQSIRRRHTYGGTDNIIVQCWANGHFMGEEFETDNRPELKLTVRGTAPVARIDLVRNAQYLYTTSPAKTEVDVTYVDNEPEPGLNYYYFRVQQEDGEIAWASPIWVNVE